MTNDERWMGRLFECIDARDRQGFVGFLHDDVEFRFGNAPPVTGRSSVGEVVGGFFDSIAALRHELERTWSEGDTVICHGTVTYTRHDTSTLHVPFANVFELEAGRVKRYLIFADVSGL